MVPCRREGRVKSTRPPLPLAPPGNAPAAEGRRQGSLWALLQDKQGRGREWGGRPRPLWCPPLTPTQGGRMRLPTEAFSCSVVAEVAALPTRSGAWMGLIRM